MTESYNNSHQINNEISVMFTVVECAWFVGVGGVIVDVRTLIAVLVGGGVGDSLGGFGCSIGG